MARRKKIEAEDDWQTNWQPPPEWRAIQLTPKQKAELRARSQASVDRARADGVYERFKQLKGKVRFSLTYAELKGFD